MPITTTFPISKKYFLTESTSTSQVIYFTDAEDTELETAVAQTGNEVVNVGINSNMEDKGNCAKMLAVLRHFWETNKQNSSREKESSREEEFLEEKKVVVEETGGEKVGKTVEKVGEKLVKRVKKGANRNNYTSDANTNSNTSEESDSDLSRDFYDGKFAEFIQAKGSGIPRQLSSDFNPFSDFLVISDDDTLWNVDALLEFLSQLDSSQPLYLGERYGHTDYFGKANLKVDGAYAARNAARRYLAERTSELGNFRGKNKDNNNNNTSASAIASSHEFILSNKFILSTPPAQLSSFDSSFGEKKYQHIFQKFVGSDYVTMGAGGILTNAALNVLFDGPEGPEGPECGGRPDSTNLDDVALGRWMNRRNVMCLHSSRFHQRRPEDYPEFQDGNSLSAIPASARPISFHSVVQDREKKLEIYERWLKEGEGGDGSTRGG
jgi:hypothetical protein